MVDVERNTISISARIYNIISERLKQSKEFSSVGEYVDFVLDELLKEENDSNVDSNTESPVDLEDLTPEERKRVEGELKKLGYI